MPSSRRHGVKRPGVALAVCLLLIVALVAGAGLLAKTVCSGVIKAATGLEAKIASMRVGLLHSAVWIRGVQLLNPTGFPQAVMVEAPEVYVDYHLGALLNGAVHLELLRLDLRRLDVVRSADGRLNLSAIKGFELLLPTWGRGKRPPWDLRNFRIEAMDLHIGTVVFTDYTKQPPLVREFTVNIHERYRNITNPSLLTGLVVSRALVKTVVGQLANLDVAGLQTVVTEGLKQSAGTLGGLLAGGAQQAGSMGRDAVGTAGDAMDGVVSLIEWLLGH